METNNPVNIHKEYWGLLTKQAISLCKKNQKLLFYVAVIVTLFGAVYLGFLKYNPEFNFLFGTFSVNKGIVIQESKISNSKTLDRSIFDLAEEIRPGKMTSQERVTAVDKIAGLQTQTEQGEVEDIGTDGLTLLIRGNSTNGNSGIARCDFSGSWKARLSLIKKGVKIKFAGTVSSYNLSDSWIVLKNCNLI